MKTGVHTANRRSFQEIFLNNGTRIINTWESSVSECALCFVCQKFKHVSKARRIPEDSREKIEEHHQRTGTK